MDESVEPKEVFLAFTVDQGGNVVNACAALGVEVIKCNCHRVNSAVLWSLGVAGSATTCKNNPMGALMKKLAACVRRLEPLRRQQRQAEGHPKAA